MRLQSIWLTAIFSWTGSVWAQGPVPSDTAPVDPAVVVSAPADPPAPPPDTPSTPTEPQAPAKPQAPAEAIADKGASTGGPPQEVLDLFVSKCSSCHSVGQGDRVGPDLKGVIERRSSDWLARFIGAPSSMLDSDADARAQLAKYNNVRMPDLGLSETQVRALIDLITHCSKNACVLAAKFTPVTKATAQDSKRGHALFVGLELSMKQGPACISCHSIDGVGTVVAGGTLSKDLTYAFARLGDQGLDAALRNPAFPVMNKIFLAAPLSESEAFALRAFLYDANRGNLGSIVGQRSPLSVPLFGGLGAGLALLLLNAAWSRRSRGIRQPLVNSKERAS